MCEIAILKPDKYSPDELKQAAMTLYERMSSSLGIVGVIHTGTKFEYEVYRDTDPDREEVLDFVTEMYEPAERLIIHGRLATHGAVIDDHAHPLEIDCPECDVDYVVHNGVVSRHNLDRRQQEREGHEYSTEVDSEVIAHSFGRVPGVNAEERFDFQPAFILMDEDRIFIQANQYHLSQEATMAHGHRDFGPSSDEEKYHRVLYYADKEEME